MKFNTSNQNFRITSTLLSKLKNENHNENSKKQAEISKIEHLNTHLQGILFKNSINKDLFLIISTLIEDILYLQNHSNENNLLLNINSQLTEYSNIINNQIESFFIGLDKEEEGNFHSRLHDFHSFWEGIVKKFSFLRKATFKLEFVQIKVKTSIWKMFISSLNSLMSPDIRRRILKTVKYLLNNMREEYVKKMMSILNTNDNDNESHLEDIDIMSIDRYSNIIYFFNFIKDTDIFNINIENEVITQTEQYYSSLSPMLSSMKIEKYLIFCNSLIKYEEKIFNKYLSDSVFSLIIKEKLESIMIISQIDFIFEKVFSKREVNIWNTTYILAKSIRIEGKYKESYSFYIKTHIQYLISKHEMLNLLEFISFLDLLQGKCFLEDDVIKQITKESLYSSINQKPTRSAELYNDFIDKFIKEISIKPKKIGKNQFDPIEFDSFIKKFVNAFKFLECKDHFIQCYSLSLINRLLYDEAVLYEIEKKTVEHIKLICGTGYVSKVEEIINDYSDSLSITSEYSRLNQKKNSIQFSFSAFSEINLREKPCFISISKEIDHLQSGLFEFYIKKFPSRSIKWKLDISSSEILFKKEYSLYANGVQTWVLLRLNAKSSIEEKTIFKAFHELERGVIKRSIDQLILKSILIKKQNSSNHVNSNDTEVCYIVNHSFSSVLKKIIMSDLTKNPNSSNANEEEDEKKVIEDRKPVIDCLIMRILKYNKVMDTEELVKMVISSSKFICSKEIVMIRIENLVNNEFIFMEDSKLKYFSS